MTDQPTNQPPQRQTPGPGLKVGAPFGIPIYLAPSSAVLGLLLAYVFTPRIAEELPQLGDAAYLLGAVLAVLLFASVLLHELAHSVVARYFGIPVRRIVLQLLGGVSELEREPEKPGRELLVAIAGPALSLLLAAGALGVAQVLPTGSVVGAVLVIIGGLNLLVGVFNLLPGLPLDGGRVLRAIVWAVTRRPLAGTLAAAWSGRIVAVLVASLPWLLASATGTQVPLLSAVWSALIGAFIWFGASASLTQARLRQRLPGLDTRQLTRRAIPVTADLPLSEALRRAREAGARGLVVVDSFGKPAGLVNEAAVTATPEHRRPWVSVAAVARNLQPGLTISVELTGEELVRALQTTPATEYLVVEPTGEIYGVLAMADVERAFTGP